LRPALSISSGEVLAQFIALMSINIGAELGVDGHEAIARNIVAALLLALNIRVLSVVDRDVLIVKDLLEVTRGVVFDRFHCRNGLVVGWHFAKEDGLLGEDAGGDGGGLFSGAVDGRRACYVDGTIALLLEY